MSFTVPNLIFVIALAVMTIWLTFETTKGGLTDNRHHNILKRLTTRGKIVVFILLVITGLLICQELNNQRQNGNQVLKLQQERDLRDNKITDGIKNGVDSISNKLFDDISTAFKKQELQLDTVNQEIINIKNKPISKYIAPDNPVLRIDSTGISLLREIGPIKKYKLTIGVKDAGATNFEIKVGILTEYKDGIYSYSIINFFPDQFKMNKNSVWETGFTQLRSEDSDRLYINVNGTYTSLDGLNKYDINDLYIYEQESRKVIIPLNLLRKKILEIIDKMPNDGSMVRF
ncbi:hypothetical protein DHD05_18840 [Arenibacter sp. N53]|uniref:hypothetical protein n=1 Tax=Arenibacter TaxID=178469 RepID=UPI000CD498F8|nr:MULTISPECIES: hypothetical protein [Arenibacter]MCM4153654.1 hypothetical protein [Arenibacter sp. N53]